MRANKPVTPSSNGYQGLRVNEAGKLEGTANITDWRDFETERDVEIEVTATSKANSPR